MSSHSQFVFFNGMETHRAKRTYKKKHCLKMACTDKNATFFVCYVSVQPYCSFYVKQSALHWPNGNAKRNDSKRSDTNINRFENEYSRQGERERGGRGGAKEWTEKEQSRVSIQFICSVFKRNEKLSLHEKWQKLGEKNSFSKTKMHDVCYIFASRSIISTKTETLTVRGRDGGIERSKATDS